MSAPKGLLRIVGDDGSHRMRREPVGSALDWSLTLGGAVKRPQVISLASLWTLPITTQEVDITCVSSGKIYRPKGQLARFIGISLSDILEYVGLQRHPDGSPIAQSVRFISRAPGACGPQDKPHETALSLATCLEDPHRVLLAGMLDDQPLPYPNGGPLRSVVQGYFFYKSVKWLSQIELSPLPLEAHKGTWERFAGYHNIGQLGGERFSPFIQSIDDTGSDGEELRYSSDDGADAIQEMQQLFSQHLAQGDISGLTIARLHEIAPDFATQPGWDSTLRWHRIPTESTHVQAAALRGTRLNQLDLRGWQMPHVNFSLATFIGSQLANPDGSQAANLQYGDFEGACFWGAALQGVDMRHAYLGGTSFVKDPHTQSGAAQVAGLQLQGARGLDEATADWLTQQGASGATATTTTPIQSGGYLPCHTLTIACSPSHTRSILQLLQAWLPDAPPALTAIQGQPAIHSRDVPHSSQLQAWIPVHQRDQLQQTLLPAIQQLELDGTPPTIAISPGIQWVWQSPQASQ